MSTATKGRLIALLARYRAGRLSDAGYYRRVASILYTGKLSHV